MTVVTVIRRRITPVGNMHSRGGTAADNVAARMRRPLDRAYLRRVGHLEDLARLGASVAAARPPSTGPRVLVLSLRGWPDHVAYESVIAHALRMRGCDVTLVNCGGGQPACEVGWARRAMPRPCDRCAWHTGKVLAGSRLPTASLVASFPWGADARGAPEAPPLAGDVDLDRMVDVSVPWFLRTSDPASAPESADARRDFMVAASAVERAAERLIDAHRPDVVFMLNGLFAAERMFRAVALARGVRAPTYEISPRAGSLVFSQDVPAPEYELGAAWDRYQHRPLSDEQRERIIQLLRDRARGVGAHERYYDEGVRNDVEALRAELGIPDGHRVVGLFTNLSWDSATLGHDVAFDSMMAWIEHAVARTGRLEDTTLVVRVHPAEGRWDSRELVVETMRARFGDDLPGNVRLIGSWGAPDLLRSARPR